jgi:hypothetical protein
VQERNDMKIREVGLLTNDVVRLADFYKKDHTEAHEAALGSDEYVFL